ncbi:MAG TPA: tyrosine-type recombinase/integrase [Candidatus Paceibacterota bacterium]
MEQISLKSSNPFGVRTFRLTWSLNRPYFIGCGRVTPSQRQLDKVRTRAGLRRFTWHTLRHTFATHLGMKGAPLHVV